MAYLGQLAVALAFVTSAAGLVFGIRALLFRTASRVVSMMVYLTFATCTIAFGALLAAFLTHDFQIIYVAGHSDKSLPLHYLMAALWGGQSGGLLLWGWLLTLFSAITLRRLQSRLPDVCMPTTVLMTFVTCFFLALLVFVADPFERFGLVPSDGQGLNPQLRTVEMLFHPPMLYLGFVGFTVPFAILLGGLWAGRLDGAVLRSIRAWMLFSWATLTVGIVLGSEWAYRELGWGGFWAWDPVENASLLPWLTGTAALHALVLTRRAGMLKITTFVLIALTFALCVFGTMLTRCGIVASKHAFGTSPLLYFFLGLLGATAIVSVATAVICGEQLRSGPGRISLVSRETLFVGCVIVLVLTTAVIFFGTMRPTFSRLFAEQEKVWTVGQYSVWSAPLVLALMALLGAGTLVGWRSQSRLAFAVRAVPAVIAGVVAWSLAYTAEVPPLLSGADEQVMPPVLVAFLVAFTAMAAVTVIGAVVADTVRLKRLPVARLLGVHTAHLGVIMILFGIAGAAYVTEKEVTLAEGESTLVRDYKVTFKGLKHRSPKGAFQETIARLHYTDGSGCSGRLKPSIVFFRESGRPHSEVDYSPGLREDLYAILAGYSADNASFKLLVNPMATWLWIGGVVLVLGGIVAAVPGIFSFTAPVPAMRQAPSAKDIDISSEAPPDDSPGPIVEQPFQAAD